MICCTRSMDLGGNRGGTVGLVSILDDSAIDRLVPGIRGVLGERGSGVLKISDVCGHVYVTYALFIVPVNGETAIEGTSPVYGDSINFFSAWMRWSAVSLPTCLTPKSSTTGENQMSLVA